MENCESPAGRFLIAISAWEVRMSLWIEVPTLSERASGETLLAFEDPHWSLNSAQWLGDSVVALRLRKYPGNHFPPEIAATIDCAARTAEINGRHVGSLTQVEHCLDASLEWRMAVPPPPPDHNRLAGFFRRLFGS
jgi:hypothetical protein